MIEKQDDIETEFLKKIWTMVTHGDRITLKVFRMKEEHEMKLRKGSQLVNDQLTINKLLGDTTIAPVYFYGN